jgi:hypothetical protein
MKRTKMMQARACDLWISPLFLKCKAFAERFCDDWYILSAKYGLIHHTTIIEPYDINPANRPAAAKREWAAMVVQQFFTKAAEGTLSPDDKYLFLTGHNYSAAIVRALWLNGWEHIKEPLHRLSIGERLARLNHYLAQEVPRHDPTTQDSV